MIMNVKKKSSKGYARARTTTQGTEGREENTGDDQTQENLMHTQYSQQPLVIQESGLFNDEPAQVGQKVMHFNERVRLKQEISNIENMHRAQAHSSNSFADSSKDMVNFLKMHNYMNDDEMAPDLSADEEAGQIERFNKQKKKKKTVAVDLKSKL